MNNSNLIPKNIGIGFGVLCLLALSSYVNSFLRPRQSRSSQGPVVTFEMVSRVKKGMTPQEVQAIIAAPAWSPTPTPGSPITQLTWMNSDYTGVGVVFENGHVINVARMGALPQEDTGE
ncbi:MAG: hypothetical protein EOO38_23030 [Cytophagaceae bacterium]|nr:MAG: hypothetical protein EOO38_23030 [Cytophagaceae bacterium]